MTQSITIPVSGGCNSHPFITRLSYVQIFFRSAPINVSCPIIGPTSMRPRSVLLKINSFGSSKADLTKYRGPENRFLDRRMDRLDIHLGGDRDADL